MTDVRIVVFNKIKELSVEKSEKVILCSSLMNLSDDELQEVVNEIEKDGAFLQELVNITTLKIKALKNSSKENLDTMKTVELDMFNRLMVVTT